MLSATKLLSIVNCWPSPAGDGTYDVNVEYELMAEHLELKDVIVSIPLP
jgi:coatomer subunit delta